MIGSGEAWVWLWEMTCQTQRQAKHSQSFFSREGGSPHLCEIP